MNPPFLFPVLAASSDAILDAFDRALAEIPRPAVVTNGDNVVAVFGLTEHQAAELSKVPGIEVELAAEECPVCEGAGWDWKRAADEDLQLDDPVDSYWCERCSGSGKAS